MENLMTVGFGSSTGPISPLGGWAQVLEAIAGRPSAARKSPQGADVTTNVPTGKKLGSSKVVESGTPQSDEQVNAFASSHVVKCWKALCDALPRSLFKPRQTRDPSSDNGVPPNPG